MKIYVPITIESAEQAEALPDGTVATHQDHWPLEKFRGVWEGCDTTWGHSQVIGWTVLVPVEAKEEWAVSHDRDAPAWSSVTKERAQSPGADETAFVRYVTTWEKA